MKKLDYEKWCKIDGTEDVMISNFGNVKTEGGFVYNTFKDKSGYVRVNLHISGKTKQVAIHRLVAKAFVPNPFNKEYVNHKNGDTTNNCEWNLEWCTPMENMMHKIFVLGHDQNGKKNPMFGRTGENNAKFVDYVMVFKDDELVGEYPTQVAACEALNWKRCRASQISRCVTHSRNAKSLHGYQFMYKTEYEKLKQADLKPRELLEHPELWVRHYWGQSAAKPTRNKSEGSTTIESIG